MCVFFSCYLFAFCPFSSLFSLHALFSYLQKKVLIWILMHMLLVVTIFGSKKEASSTLVIRRQYEFMLIVAICPVKRVCRRSACVARLPPAGQTKFTQFSYLVTKVRFDHARIVVTFINLCDFAKITQFQTRFNISFLPSSLGLYNVSLYHFESIFLLFVFFSLRSK